MNESMNEHVAGLKASGVPSVFWPSPGCLNRWYLSAASVGASWRSGLCWDLSERGGMVERVWLGERTYLRIVITAEWQIALFQGVHYMPQVREVDTDSLQKGT